MDLQMVRDGELAPPVDAPRRRTRSHRSPRHSTLLSARAVLGRWPALGRAVRSRLVAFKSKSTKRGS